MIYWAIARPDSAALEAAVDLFLSPPERERLDGMRFPKRRSDWLLGRWAAKRLAAQTVPVLAGLSPADFAILNEATGAPFLALMGDRRVPAALSISHRDNLAACALSLRADLRLGIDLERVESRPAGFLQDYYTQGEQAFARALEPDAQAVWVTAAWSLKEAVLKALGVGLRLDTRQVEVALAPSPPEFRSFSECWMAAGVRLIGQGEHAFQAGWRRLGAFVLTLVIEGSTAAVPLDWEQEVQEAPGAPYDFLLVP